MRYYRFLSRLLPRQDKRRLVVLTGARQTGKTTLAKSLYRDLRYFNLDAPENREAVRSIPTGAWARTVGSAVFDEAQKEPSVFEKIKYAFDEQAIDFSILLGSSQILLLKKVRESLAGRATLRELWPLMMCELAAGPRAEDALPSAASDLPDAPSLSLFPPASPAASSFSPAVPPAPLLDRILQGEKLDSVLAGLPAVSFAADDAAASTAEMHLLAWGGMPALLDLTPDERRQWLKDYERTYLERDLSDLTRLDDLLPFAKFQRLAALRSGGLLNYSELARDAGLSVDTARRYLEYLRLSYQVVLLPPFSRNLTSAVVKTPKVYWTDLGLWRRLTGRSEETGGEAYETMVVAEIVKWVGTAGREVDVFFYRTRSGLEVDLLLGLGDDRTIGIEIKSRKMIVPSDARAMRDVAAALGPRWLGGIVAYRGDEIKKIAEPSIWSVPARRLLT